MNIFKLLSKPEPTIDFFSVMPDVMRIAPIVSASHFKPLIVLNSAMELSKAKKDTNFGSHKVHTTAKCPGIKNLVNYGWVMTTWQDIVIETKGDGVGIQWESAVDQRSLIGGDIVGEAVGFHSANQYADYIGGTIPNAVSTVIKLHMPWRCVVPEGYYLQEGGLPYSDEKRFTTVKGFFSREDGVAQMNVQLLWHVMNGRTVIKAGTPIAHYMLLPKDQPKLVVRSASEKDMELERAMNLEVARTLVSNRTERKCVFDKLFNGV